MTTTVVLDAEQQQIRDVARRYLQESCGSDRLRELASGAAGFDAERWVEIGELGWRSIGLPEEHGGLGYGMIERCLLLEEMGRVLLPSPFLSSAVLVADMIDRAATPEACAALLPRLVAGQERAALIAPGVFGEPDPGLPQLEARAASDCWEINGPGGLVLDGGSAELLVVVAPVEHAGQGVFAVDADDAGVASSEVPVIDPTRRFASVELTRARAQRIDSGLESTAVLVQEALDRSTVALAAEMVGGAQRCVEMTLEYVRDREQFGVPIGSFQAVKHRCADMSIEADAAREAVYLAADVIASGDLEHLTVAASAAKIAAGDAFLAVAAATIQLHGGIGYTWEHDSHLFHKRALVSGRMLGSSAEHRDRLARAFGV